MSRIKLRDERGMTLIELLVATSAGMVVFGGLTMIVVTTMHQSTRVTNRVHATQEARTVVHRLTNELHSACIAPQLAPVQSGSSSTSLSFVSQADGEKGSVVAPTPVKRTVSLSGTTLTEYTYPKTGGSVPSWTFASSPSSTRTLMKRVSAIPGVPLFSYYAYKNGQISSTPLQVPLNQERAEEAVQVNIALEVSPPGAPVADPKAAGHVQDSALLRFTSPSYNTAAGNLPCE